MWSSQSWTVNTMIFTLGLSGLGGMGREAGTRGNVVNLSPLLRELLGKKTQDG